VGIKQQQQQPQPQPPPPQRRRRRGRERDAAPATGVLMVVKPAARARICARRVLQCLGMYQILLGKQLSKKVTSDAMLLPGNGAAQVVQHRLERMRSSVGRQLCGRHGVLHQGGRSV
jgi:hypothetical protein